VEVEWYESEFPGPTFDIKSIRQRTTIDGFQARIQEESGSALAVTPRSKLTYRSAQ